MQQPDMIGLYDSDGGRVGTLCTSTGRAQIGAMFYVPERTCHMELRKSGAIYDVFYFDCCCEEYAESKTDQYASALSGKVCPYCGAKVVD